MRLRKKDPDLFVGTKTSKPSIVAHDRNGDPITEGDFVRFLDSTVEGIVVGINHAVLDIAVPGYGRYGLWPQNAIVTDRLRKRRIHAPSNVKDFEDNDPH